MSVEQIQNIAIERLKTLPQIRKEFDPQIISAIAESLLECGQLQPIRVRQCGDDFVIVDGELRYRAAKVAQFKTVNVVVEAKELREAEVIHRQFVANCHRSNLSDLEKAKAIDLLMKETGWPASQTAAKLGLANGTITKLLSLLSLPPAIQERLQAGKIASTVAYDLSRIADRRSTRCARGPRRKWRTYSRWSGPCHKSTKETPSKEKAFVSSIPEGHRKAG